MELLKINGKIPFKQKYKELMIDQYRFGYGNDFVITITVSAGGTFTLPLRPGYTYNFTCNWGDNSSSVITAYNDVDITHTYTNAGDYTIIMSGTIQAWYFNNGGDKLKLKSIDNWGDCGFTTMDSAFYGCTNLTTIPNKPINNSQIVNFSLAFYGCTGLTGSIPTDLFRYNTNVSINGFSSVFQGCTGLTGSIPTDLFRYNTNVSTNGFRSAFQGCTGLTGSIPTDLFRYNTNVSINGFNNTFYRCTGLSGSIPADLFRYNVNVSTYGFSYTFYGCTGLSGSIPEDLFRYNTLVGANGFSNTFTNCSGLTGSIPVDLFRYNTLVSTSGFDRTFYGCTGLSGPLPTDLFRYNTLVSSNGFRDTFYGCTGLSGSIPEDLFYYNSLCTNYQNTFCGCRSLILPTRLFNLSNLSIVTTFENFMRVSSTSYSFTGTIQDIWNYTTATSTDAFDQCTAISNYADIPTAWK